jgi:alkaline phosphatase D
MRPTPDGMRIYTTATWGRLAQLALLDTRQYRSYPPCRHTQTDEFGRVCGDFSDPNATLLGAIQEAWVDRTLQNATAQWNLLAQQILMARSDEFPGPEEKLRTQSWDGYPAARTRLFDSLVNYRVSNPIILSGDVHSFWVNDLRRDFLRPEQAPVAAEIVTTSISSYGGDDSYINLVRQDAPHVKFATARFRGYARLDVTPVRTTCDLRAVVKVQDPASLGFTLSSWVVENQRAGIARA